MPGAGRGGGRWSRLPLRRLWRRSLTWVWSCLDLRLICRWRSSSRRLPAPEPRRCWPSASHLLGVVSICSSRRKPVAERRRPVVGGTLALGVEGEIDRGARGADGDRGQHEPDPRAHPDRVVEVAEPAPNPVEALDDPALARLSGCSGTGWAGRGWAAGWGRAGRRRRARGAGSRGGGGWRRRLLRLGRIASAGWVEVSPAPAGAPGAPLFLVAPRIPICRKSRTWATTGGRIRELRPALR